MIDRSEKHLLAPGALGAVVGTLYVLTAARTVVFIDSGELATVAWTLGIAHPTGYPLYTLVGWLAAHFPVPGEPVFRLNLLSSLLSLSAVLIFYSFLRRLGETRLAGTGKGASRGEGAGLGTSVAAALFGAGTLAFSETFWSGSTSVEVYPLHALFLVLLLGTFLDAFVPPGKERGEVTGGMRRRALLFAFLLGLSFSNHLSTVYLAPAFLFTYFRIRRVSAESLRALIRLAPAFLLGLTPYLYLPIRASAGPLMDWGNPTGWEAIFRHLSGRQYSVWIFSSPETAARQLRYFFSGLGGEFAWLPLISALLGLRFLFSRQRTLFYFFLLLFAGCLFFAVNYDIHDINSYFLLAYVAVAALAGIGVHAIGSGLRGAARTAGLAAGAAFLIVQAFLGYPRVDQSDLRVVTQYATSILGSVEEGALVMSYQWDYFVSASYYLQVVDRYRPDVIVVDKELLRRSWYIDVLRRRYPRLMERAEPATRAYLAELFKFEHSLPYDPRIIEARYGGFISALLAAQEGPLYVLPEIEEQYTAGYSRVPHGLAFRLVKPGEDAGWRDVPVVIDSPPPRNTYVDQITMFAAQGELNNALYLERVGRLGDAAKAADRAVAIRPDFQTARSIRQRLSR